MGEREAKMWRLSYPDAKEESRSAYMLVRGGAEESCEKSITVSGRDLRNYGSLLRMLGGQEPVIWF